MKFCYDAAENDSSASSLREIPATSCLSNQFPNPHAPTPSKLYEISTDKLDCKVIVLGLVMCLILDLTIQTISLALLLLGLGTPRPA